MPLGSSGLRPLGVRSSYAFAAAALAICACFGGCVERRMLVRTNPPGAMLYVDDYPIGTTPIATNFVYYGVRKIRLVKDGYETLTVMQPIAPPWYEITPLDFVSENFIPGQIRDVRSLDFQLAPQAVVPPDQLLSRAEALRRGSHALAVPPASAAPTVRFNQPPSGPALYVPPQGAETVPAPSPLGGQTVYPLPPR
jgi:hypothetical protein